MNNNYIFISHGTKYNELLITLRKGIEDKGLKTRVASHEAASGDELNPDTKQTLNRQMHLLLSLGQKR